MSKKTSSQTPSTTTATDQAHGHDHAGHTHNHPAAATNSAKPDQNSAIQPNSELQVTIPWATVQPVYQKNLQKMAQQVKAPGFRVGKVPMAMAEQIIDPNKVLDPTIREVFPAAYQQALTAAKKAPISQPEIDPIELGKGKDWVFTVYFAETQELTLGKYQDVVKKAHKAAEKEIVEQDQKRAEEKPAEQDKPAEQNKSAVAPQATKPLTDEQKDDIRFKHIFKELVLSTEPKVQEILVRDQVNREISRLADQLQQLHIPPEDYLKSRGMNLDQLRGEYAGMALSQLQIEFLLAAIAKDQKITVEDKEIEETLEKIDGGKLSAKTRQDAEYRSYIFSNLLKQKVLKHLLTVK